MLREVNHVAKKIRIPFYHLYKCLEHSDHLSSHDYTNMHSKNVGASKDGTHQLHGSTTMTLAGRGGSWGGNGALVQMDLEFVSHFLKLTYSNDCSFWCTGVSI